MTEPEPRSCSRSGSRRVGATYLGSRVCTHDLGQLIHCFRRRGRGGAAVGDPTEGGTACIVPGAFLPDDRAESEARPSTAVAAAAARCTNGPQALIGRSWRGASLDYPQALQSPCPIGQDFLPPILYAPACPGVTKRSTSAANPPHSPRCGSCCEAIRKRRPRRASAYVVVISQKAGRRRPAARSAQRPASVFTCATALRPSAPRL